MLTKRIKGHFQKILEVDICPYSQNAWRPRAKKRLRCGKFLRSHHLIVSEVRKSFDFTTTHSGLNKRTINKNHRKLLCAQKCFIYSDSNISGNENAGKMQTEMNWRTIVNWELENVKKIETKNYFDIFYRKLMLNVLE